MPEPRHDAPYPPAADGLPGRRVAPAWSRPPASLVERFAALPAGVVADAMHRIGALDGGIAPVWPGATVVGAALTVWVRAGDNALVARAIDMAQPGDVLVVNAQGALTSAVVGELLSMECRRRGVRGAVVDGAVRDLDVLGTLRFPVFARGVCAAGPTKEGSGEIGYPVAVGGVVAAAGDIVVADGDGVVIVPAGDAGAVLERAAAISGWEERRRAALLSEG